MWTDLVIKGAKDDLDPLTGVFPPYDGLFLVSRDLGNETVWLVSNHHGPELAFVAPWLEYDERGWLPGVWATLQEISPGAFTHPERLQWGIYAAPKAEGRHDGSIPTEERIEQCGIANLWAVWPTKLTLAPTASYEVRHRIQKLIPRPTGWAAPPAAWRISCGPVEVAPECWLKTPLIPWDMFRRCYL
jgi:hypothetical protein